MGRRWQAVFGVLALLLAGMVARPPVVASDDATAVATCTLSGRYLSWSDDLPVSGIQIIHLAGGSTSTDASGIWRLVISDNGLVKLRVITPVTVYNPSELLNYGVAAVVPAGTVEVTYRITGLCFVELYDIGVVYREEGPVSRPTPPPLPDGFRPSDATRAAVAPDSFPGNPANLPWLGGFWLSAPEVQVGICGPMDFGSQNAAEVAIQKWQEATAAGLAWKLVRNDAACEDSFTQPRLLIKRQLVSQRRFVLGRTILTDTSGADCTIDLRGSSCWIGAATVALNPPGFDRLPRDEQMITVLHEVGHALGLAHNRGCGDSLMWFDAGGCSGRSPDRPGIDDISSLNELLATTLKALRPAP